MKTASALRGERLQAGTQVVQCLDIDFEPHRDEQIEIRCVEEIKALAWQDGEDEPPPDEEAEED